MAVAQIALWLLVKKYNWMHKNIMPHFDTITAERAAEFSKTKYRELHQMRVSAI